MIHLYDNNIYIYICKIMYIHESVEINRNIYTKDEPFCIAENHIWDPELISLL